MRLTCSTRSFPSDRLSLSLARIQWAGFEAAEVDLTPKAAAEPEGEAIRDALATNEVDLSAVDAGELEFASVEQALEAAAHLGRCALLANQLDGPRVVFRAADGTRQLLASALAKLFAAMPGYAVAFCPVNTIGTLLSSPEDFEDLRQRLELQAPSECLGLALDPTAALADGWDPDEFARAAEVPLRYVYLTDTLEGKPAVPGSGELDWELLIDALRADGYDGYLSLLLPAADLIHAEADAKEARGYAEALIHRAH
jgi:sugar phosphate isomerase/epimerase